MSRFSHHDTDAARLPQGMTRVGYDADTQVYTYRDSKGRYWEGASGAQYGRLTRAGSRSTTKPDPDPSFYKLDPEVEEFLDGGWAEERKLGEPAPQSHQSHQSLADIVMVVRLFLRRHSGPIPVKTPEDRLIQLRGVRGSI